MTFVKSLLVLGLLLALFGCTKQAPQVGQAAATASPSANESKRVTSVGVVKAIPQPVEVKAGGTSPLVVSLTIQNGYHVNANPPTFSYLKPTQLDITPSDGISASPIFYPPPVNKKFAFAEKPLAIYEGDSQLKATVKADTVAIKGEHSLAALLRIQACDDQVCYPPGQIQLRIPVTVK